MPERATCMAERPPFTADPTRFRKILSPSTYSVSSRGIIDHEFDFSEEQQMVRDSIARFVQDDYDWDTRKAIVASDERDESG